ncbi:MAG: ATP-binding protein [Pseudomonadota bacterium]
MSDDTIIRLMSSPLAPTPAPVEPTNEFQWRALGALGIFRLLIAVLLMAAFASSDSPRFFGELSPQLFLLSLLAWFVVGVLGAYACSTRRVPVVGLTEMQLFVDIAAISVLSLASGGAGTGIAGLLIIFIGAGSFILSSLMALFFAALATLSVLAVQVYLHAIGAIDLLEYPAAGLLSAVIFAVVLAIRPLSRRLAQSEALARQQVIDIANLAELNRYVVQQLREAIIVVDGDNEVRLVNDAAANHLGITRAMAVGKLGNLAPDLAAYVNAWRAGQPLAEVGEQTTLPGHDGARLQVHIAPFGDNSRERSPLLVFLEDVSVLAERVQQSKLASLGRLSASIAHEIRNPLGAISHASQLLAEQNSDTSIGKLTDIIERNAVRVSSIVEDIMHMSRRDSSRPKSLVLAEWLSDFVQEYVQTVQIDPRMVALRGDEAITEIIFDPGHLHQIMENLLDNARQHGQASVEHPVRISWGRAAGSRRPYLDVTDSGPGIAPENEERIFEPFFTQHDTGTGLGLYLCQELCELNRATLSYRRAEAGGSTLHIVFADPKRWSGVG